MPAPSTTVDLLDLIAKSRLVGESTLKNYRESRAGEQPPGQLAEQLIRDGVLTPFQASLLLEGKWRPFFLGPYKVLSRLGTVIPAWFTCVNTSACSARWQ